MKYTIYSSETGKIEKSVVVPSHMIDMQYDPEFQGVLEGSFDDSAFYVESGQPVAMPTKPSPHHIFDYTTKQWVDPRTPETEWPLVRDKRNRLLTASDWTQLPDVPLATKEAWSVYRQALRDVTLQPDPFNIVWPAPPA